MTWELYIIQTKDKKLYTGITTDLDRRLKDHQSGKKGARFFRFSEPEKVLYRESHPNRSEASQRESEIKKMSRKQKLDLIAPQKKSSLKTTILDKKEVSQTNREEK